MTEGATAVTCLDEAIKLHHKSSLAPDESIELPVLRNPPIVDVHSQQPSSHKVNHSLFMFQFSCDMMQKKKKRKTGATHILYVRLSLSVFYLI